MGKTNRENKALPLDAVIISADGSGKELLNREIRQRCVYWKIKVASRYIKYKRKSLHVWTWTTFFFSFFSFYSLDRLFSTSLLTLRPRARL